MWQPSDYEAEQTGDHEPKLLVTVRAETLTEGLAEYEQLKDLELPEGIEEVYVALQAGTDRQPWVYDMRSVGDRYHTNSDAPITILALPQANLLAARQLLDTAEARLGESSALNYHDAGTAATLDVAHSGEPQTCSEYEAYAQVARELIATDLELTITLSYDKNANGTGTPAYEKTLPEDTSIENSEQGCLAE